MIMKKKQHENKELKPVKAVKPVSAVKSVVIIGVDLPLEKGVEYKVSEKNAKVLIEAGAAKLK